MKIKKIHIVEHECGNIDDIYLETDLQTNVVKTYIGNEDFVTLHFYVMKGSAVQYCKEHFPRIKRVITNNRKGLYRSKTIKQREEEHKKKYRERTKDELFWDDIRSDYGG